MLSSEVFYVFVYGIYSVTAPGYDTSESQVVLSGTGINNLSEGYFCNLSKVLDIYLDSNLIEEVPSRTFCNLPILEYINLSENRIKTVAKDAFSETPSVTEIYLDSNLLEELPDNIFNGLSKLQHVDLDGNLLQEWPGRAFNHLPNLKYAKLSNNKIRTLTEEAFWGTPKLTHLYLANNMIEINELPVRMFNTLPNLQYIYMSNNSIRTLTTDSFWNLSDLSQIHLNYNLIGELPDRVFNSLPSLKHIFLSNNRIKFVSKDAFWGTPGLTLIDLSHNELIEVPPELFSLHVFLGNVYLDGNYFRTLPASYSPFFSRPKLRIFVEDNPWHCTCDIEWMFHLPEVKDKLSCASPETAVNVTNITQYFDESLRCDVLTADTGDVYVISVVLGVAATMLVSMVVASVIFLLKMKCSQHLVFPKVPMTYNLHYYIPESDSEWTSQSGQTVLTVSRDGVESDRLDDMLPGCVGGRLRLKRLLGEGAFGDVYEGETSCDDGRTWLRVAVKRHRGQTNGCLRSLVDEFRVLHDVGTHPNVISVYSCTVIEGNFLMIMELADNGDLHGFLRTYERENRQLIGGLNEEDEKMFLLNHEPRIFTFAWQVAKGLEFLASEKVIHRDIAARNILLTSGNVAKISDFGLSVDVYQSGYYSQESMGRLPLKWMGPEAVTTGRFTLQSDVWSYGVLLWEVVSLGAAPYPGVDPRLLDTMYKSGYVMPPPTLCPDALYKLMRQCWEYKPSKRPSFSYIVEKLYTFIQGSLSTNYVQFMAGDANEDQANEEQKLLSKMLPVITEE